MKSAAASVSSRFLFSSNFYDRTLESMNCGKTLTRFSYRMITQDIAVIQLKIIPVKFPT